MNRLRLLVAAALVAGAGGAHANTDAEVHRWLDELVGSTLVLQELAAGYCSDFTGEEPADVEALYSWALSLASPTARAAAEATKTGRIAQARARASQWVADEFRGPALARPAQQSCQIYGGIFRTIRDAARAQLHDIEYALTGRTTPGQPQR